MCPPLFKLYASHYPDAVFRLISFGGRGVRYNKAATGDSDDRHPVFPAMYADDGGWVNKLYGSIESDYVERFPFSPSVDR